MDQAEFWGIIAEACQPDPRRSDEWDGRLRGTLARWPAGEIVEWNHIFDGLAARAYTEDLWGAAYLINGGASDDGFYYFRCWLICMGRDVYESATADPDSLAGVAIPGVDAEAETYAAAHEAWIAVTGNPDTAPYAARNEDAELRGEDWDFDDLDEASRRLPRLYARFGRE